MTVSPIWATMPPITDGSTVTLTVIFLPVSLLSASARRLLLIVVERDRGADFGDGLGAGVGGLGDEGVDDRRKFTSPASSHHKADQRRRDRMRTRTEEVLDDPLTEFGGDGLVGERVAQLVVGLDDARDRVQLVLDGRDRVFRFGHGVERRRITLSSLAHRVTYSRGC